MKTTEERAANYTNKYYAAILKLAHLAHKDVPTQFKNAWEYMAGEAYRYGGRTPVSDAKKDWDITKDGG